MDKDWQVQVVFSRSDRGIVQVQMNTRTAKLFAEGHENITNCVRERVGAVAQYIDEQTYKSIKADKVGYR